MELTGEQDRALLEIDRWAKDPGAPQVYKLFGPAGTGKSSLAKYFAQTVSGLVLFGCYTGKGAYVMVQRGCVGATTIHKMMYKPKDKSRVRLIELQDELDHLEALHPGPQVPAVLVTQRALVEEEKKRVSAPAFSLAEDSAIKLASLVIIDEVSMVGEREGTDLLSFGKKVLVLGDPFQLPPVFGAGFFTQGEPDFMLREIHRQARDNPIIRMSMTIREGGALNLGSYGSSKVIELAKVDRDEVMAAEQLLVGLNATRRATNRRVRSLRQLDKSSYPVSGDKLVCLRNDHEMGLLNGSIWYATEDAKDPGQQELEVYLNVQSEDGGEPLLVSAHKAYFDGGEPRVWDRREFQEFDYGYALTVHKAQGSQWQNGFLFDEWRNAETRRRWQYTGLTRFADKVTMVRM